jgi:hypothetical protein
MKKQIIEEILRMQLLTKYDNSSTLSENKTLIPERIGSSIDDIIKSKETVSAIDRAVKSGVKFGGFTTKSGKLLRNADEIVDALAKGKFSSTESGRVYAAIFKNTSDTKILSGIADKIMNQDTWIKNYGSLDKKSFFSSIQKKYKLPTKQVDELWKANTRRLSKIDDVVDSTRKIDQVTDSAEDYLRKQGINININNYVNTEKAVSGVVDDVAKSKGFSNADDWVRKDPKSYKTYMDKEIKRLPKKEGIFSRFINWGRRSITFSLLLGIAKWGAIGYGVWWLYKQLSDTGIDTICDDENEVFVQYKGCVPKKTKGGGGSEEGGTESSKINVVTDNEGNKYEECEGIYYKGCVNKKGNSDIKKAQDCLGVTPNGFFNQETETALYKKINKKSFSSSDLDTICARSYGGGIFQL